jgi:hypothetical protein
MPDLSLNLLERSATGSQSANGFPDFFGTCPFDQVCLRPGLQGAAPILIAFISGHRDNPLSWRRARHEIIDHLESVVPRYPQVEQKHVRTKLIAELTGLFAVGRLGDDHYILLGLKNGYAAVRSEK